MGKSIKHIERMISTFAYTFVFLHFFVVLAFCVATMCGIEIDDIHHFVWFIVLFPVIVLIGIFVLYFFMAKFIKEVMKQDDQRRDIRNQPGRANVNAHNK